MNVNTNLVAVTFLGLVCCLCVGGIVILEMEDKAPPQALIGLSYVCGGAIAGFLGFGGRGPQGPEVHKGTRKPRKPRSTQWWVLTQLHHLTDHKILAVGDENELHAHLLVQLVSGRLPPA